MNYKTRTFAVCNFIEMPRGKFCECQLENKSLQKFPPSLHDIGLANIQENYIPKPV